MNFGQTNVPHIPISLLPFSSEISSYNSNYQDFHYADARLIWDKQTTSFEFIKQHGTSKLNFAYPVYIR